MFPSEVRVAVRVDAEADRMSWDEKWHELALRGCQVRTNPIRIRGWRPFARGAQNKRGPPLAKPEGTLSIPILRGTCIPNSARLCGIKSIGAPRS